MNQHRPTGPWRAPGKSPQGSSTSRPVPPKNSRRWMIAIGSLMVVGIVVSVSTGADEGGSASSPAASTTARAASSTTEPSPEPSASSTTEPSPEPSPEQVPERHIEGELTEVIREDVPTATVVYTKDDNTVHVIVVTMGGIRAQTKPILKAVKDANINATLRIDALADLKDRYGNSSADTVLRVMYRPETVARIDPDGIDLRHIWAVADESYVHPALEW